VVKPTCATLCFCCLIAQRGERYQQRAFTQYVSDVIGCMVPVQLRHLQVKDNHGG